MNDEIKLGRVGHYSVAGACQEARICYVYDATFDKATGLVEAARVNVAGDNHEGDHFARRDVRVGTWGDDNEEFHLNRDCPSEK